MCSRAVAISFEKLLTETVQHPSQAHAHRTTAQPQRVLCAPDIESRDGNAGASDRKGICFWSHFRQLHLITRNNTSYRFSCTERIAGCWRVIKETNCFALKFNLDIIQARFCNASTYTHTHSCMHTHCDRMTINDERFVSKASDIAADCEVPSSQCI